MQLYYDFPLFLTLAVLLTGAITALDIFLFSKRRAISFKKASKAVEFSRSFFPALLFVWIIRSFLIQPYRVPTGSLEPTVMPGDFIAVKQYAYALKLPVLRYNFYTVAHPKRGDVALFFWPVDERIRFVKRVVGVPGDHVSYKNKTLYINGQEIKQEFVAKTMSVEPGQAPSTVEHYKEDLMGVVHDMYVRPDVIGKGEYDVSVPDGYYFMMGDNRDDSDDSRYWGLVPEANFIGQAFGVWMSWDANLSRVRWDRIGQGIS